MTQNPITMFLASMGVTRDGWFLFWTKWSAVVVGLAALGGGITKLGLPESWVPYLALGSFIIGITSANHQTSGLPSSDEKSSGAGVGSVSTRMWLLPVALLLGTAAFAGSTAACGTAARSVKQTVTLDILQPTHDAMANFQDLEIATFNAGSVKALTPEAHRSIEGKLATAFTDHAKAARAVRAWRAGDPVPQSVTDLAKDIDDTAAVVKATFPGTSQVVAYIQTAADTVAQVVTSLKTGAK